MAKLIFTENGKQIHRTFTELWVIRPDGRMAQPKKIGEGYTFLLTTGEDGTDGRPLTVLMPESAPKRHLARDAMAFGLGAIAMVLYAVRFATF